jgi:hypothetical protein
LVETLIGAMNTCRCLLCRMMIVNESITPMCASSAIDSIHSFGVAPSGSSRLPTPSETNAPESYGRFPSAAAAPRNRNIVQMTLKIMKRISHAPPVCEP